MPSARTCHSQYEKPFKRPENLHERRMSGMPPDTQGALQRTLPAVRYAHDPTLLRGSLVFRFESARPGRYRFPTERWSACCRFLPTRFDAEVISLQALLLR